MFTICLFLVSSENILLIICRNFVFFSFLLSPSLCFSPSALSVFPLSFSLSLFSLSFPSLFLLSLYLNFFPSSHYHSLSLTFFLLSLCLLRSLYLSFSLSFFLFSHLLPTFSMSFHSLFLLN